MPEIKTHQKDSSIIDGGIHSTSYRIMEEDKARRIDLFLADQLNDLTRSRIQSLIRNGHVTVNGFIPKPGYRLKAGDNIILFIPAPVEYHLKPEPMEIFPIHEDSSLIVLYKPPGLVIHPSPGHDKGTLVHGLLQHCKDLSGIGGILRPGIVHRLDKDTSGIMVVAKSDYSHEFLAKQFKNGNVNKRYIALVHGSPDNDEGVIDQPISRHPIRRKEMAVVRDKGKKALTIWQKMDEIGGLFTLISVILKTGRTHQIRVHFSHMGYPIVGDQVYGHRKKWWKKYCPSAMDIIQTINRQMLHSQTLGFIHPATNEYCEFQAPIPDDMSQAIKSLKLIFHQEKKDNKS